MTTKVFIKKVFDKLYKYIWFNRIYSGKFQCNQIKKKVTDKNIWLLGIPRSTNLGDQAQVLCSEKLFREQFPEFTVFEYDSRELMKQKCMLLDCISSQIKKDDIIFFQSGYNLTDMYPFQEQMHRETVKRIKDNIIVFLPQTISFKKPYVDNTFVQESNSLYQHTKRILLMCRDKESQIIANEALPGVKTIAFPDVVTTLIGKTAFKSNGRSGILLCVRNDEEGLYSTKELFDLKKSLQSISETDIIDTTIPGPSQFFIRRNREKYVFEMINLMHSKKVVITDRYHGLIFSVVANTPVVLLKTIDHKISGGMQWFTEEMQKNIKIADSIKEAIEYANRFYNEQNEFKNGDYFYRNFYRHMRQIIDKELAEN